MSTIRSAPAPIDYDRSTADLLLNNGYRLGELVLSGALDPDWVGDGAPYFANLHTLSLDYNELRIGHGWLDIPLLFKEASNIRPLSLRWVTVRTSQELHWASSLTYLHLHAFSAPSRVFLDILSSMPCLQELHADQCQSAYGPLPQAGRFLDLPSLRKADITTSVFGQENDERALVHTQKTIGRLIAPRLKDLAPQDIEGTQTDDLCRFVQSASASLTSLILDIGNDDNGHSILKLVVPMLDNFSSLRTLKISNHTPSSSTASSAAILGLF
ncbi:hypothetical protein BDV98DRAFT_597552 [Pterulicium gracile]|uniref:F-box domain-containing protein n=1 Tax=Pterulicium gracile TaxID=1884261 RepID=A0A5C3Q346_9AGAR|nr:hypothetical protein BDV98DRAFT_597552 [Pterula gracilis]